MSNGWTSDLNRSAGARAMSWGPFLPNLDHAERLARLRSLRAIVRMRCGPRARLLDIALQDAERDDDQLAYAAAEFARLAPLDQRRVLATFAEVL